MILHLFYFSFFMKSCLIYNFIPSKFVLIFCGFFFGFRSQVNNFRKCVGGNFYFFIYFLKKQKKKECRGGSWQLGVKVGCKCQL